MRLEIFHPLMHEFMCGFLALNLLVLAFVIRPISICLWDCRIIQLLLHCIFIIIQV